MNNIKYNFKNGDIIDSNNFGKFEFLEEFTKIINGKKVRFGRVKFLNTGTIVESRIVEIACGRVKDPYALTISGVGYLGNSSNKKYTKREYDMWRNMILRCYDKNSCMYKFYGALGITVCERWHCFEYFLDDLPTLYGYDKYLEDNTYQLDKDFLQKDLPANMKIYSPSTCIFLNHDTNARIGSYSKYCNDKTSDYRGVYKLSNGNFQCRVQINGTDYFLGTYMDEIAAANMYNYAIVGIEDESTVINDVPFMTLQECLEYKTRNQPIKMPPNANYDEIEKYNSNANFKGVFKHRNCFIANFSTNGNQTRIGAFDDKIAAANAYNYYVSRYSNMETHKLNDVPYMSVDEWIHHKHYAKNNKPVLMTESTLEPENERKNRCLSIYGIEFY